MVNKTLTHLSSNGVRMVDVCDKLVTRRIALARGKIYLKESTINLVENEELNKGNVLVTAQIAAISAVKSTHHLIPLCHSLRITGVDVDFQVERNYIMITVNVNSTGKTGVEMEALTGVSVGLLTVWDMVKSVEKDENGQYPSTTISEIEVIKKEKD
jgi:cyclic pyranopterin phosphate synthase